MSRDGGAAGGARSLILHLGIGSFHRAHQAAYLQDLFDCGDERWSLVSGNVRPGMEDTVRVLLEQQGRYTLETVTPNGERRYRRIASLQRVLPFAPGLGPMLSVGSDPRTRIISFTVTEAGYYLDASGELDFSHPEIRADLDAVRAGGVGTTLYGTLAALLRERHLRSGTPVTLLCCDNLRSNGERSRTGLLQFLERTGDSALLAWVRGATSSPNAMVDRITPRPDAALRERVRAATGIPDAAPVMSEQFAQWVIEDRFCTDRPDWERVGVQMVSLVAPYEEAKIRILNASHSVLAWAGALLGHQYVHQAVRDPQVTQWVRAYVAEVVPCLTPSPIDLEAYLDATLERFGNAALADRLERIAQDSYAKLATFVVPTICERLRRSNSLEGVAMLPALFLAYLQCWRRGGPRWSYRDDTLSQADAIALAGTRDPVAALCADRGLWSEFAADARLCTAVRLAQRRLQFGLAPP